jgi:choline-sulfatase
VPLIVAGEGVPEGQSVDTPVSLVDAYPSVLGCVGLERLDDDDHLPGHSLFDLATGADPERLVFGEFHAAASDTGIFMVRRGHNYVGYSPQLFDLAKDPQETNDLTADPAYRKDREDLDRALREIVDPEAVDARAKADQAARIAAAGGRRAILEKGSFGYTPAPGEAVVYG